MDLAAFINDRYEWFGAHNSGRLLEHFERISKMVQSPIEERLAIALAVMECPIYFTPRGGVYFHEPLPGWIDPVHAKTIGDTDNDESYAEWVDIIPQQKVEGYRVDFLIIAKFHDTGTKVHRIVVECDGHDFHERTKEQAQRDREMDRKLQQAGYRVFRFTGSDIFRDACKCVEEVRRYLNGLAVSDSLKSD